MDNISNVVLYKGKPAIHLNARLISQKGLNQNQVAAIKALHVVRLNLEDDFQDGVIDKRTYRTKWVENEFKLQLAWGFKEDANYHRFWYMKGCTCPKMDNDDAYPFGYYVVSKECPVHGD